MTRAFASAALAAAFVIASAGASMAATWAYVDDDANVRQNHSNNSAVINHIDEGEEVRVIGQWNNWYKIQIPGPDGWVRANVLDFDFDDDDDYPSHPGNPGFGSSFCVDGSNAQFCLGTQF